VDPSPEPDDLNQNDWEEDGLEGQPDLGETSILVDGCQPNINLKITVGKHPLQVEALPPPNKKNKFGTLCVFQKATNMETYKN
jgi:hypothetical protein